MIFRIKKRVKKLTSNLNVIRTLRLIWSVERGATTLAIIFIIIESISFLAALYIFRLLINAIAQPARNNPEAVKQIAQYFIATVIITVFYVAIKAISVYVAEIQASKVSEYIDDKIHASAVKLDLAFYESPAYFDTLQRARDAGPERANSVVINLVELVKAGIMLVSIGSVIVSINFFLLPLLLLFISPTFFVRISLADKLHALWLQQTHLQRKSLYLSSLITGDASAKEIRSFSLGEYLKSLYLNIRMKLLTERLSISRKSAGIEITTTILATLSFFACLGYICFSTLQGRNSIGDVTVFMVVFPQTFNVMQQLSTAITKMYSNSIYMNNVFELLDLKPTLTETGNPVPVPNDEGMDIVMKKVSFAYPHSDAPVLKNVSLTIPAGKIVAVIGFNGAGKTTLTKLLCRLYDPTSGSITLGGIDIRKFNSTDYRQQISAVFQDFVRYNLSVADNIRFGDINGNHLQSDIIDAGKKSGADEFVTEFPDGYNTMMGRLFEEGHEVSFGQWQKLAIARSFYRSSRFIIFDEASSALDACAEQELFESFRERIGNRAALIISHRLSTIMHADYIYVLSEGQIKQEGTHEELIEIEGDYASLFKSSPLVS